MCRHKMEVHEKISSVLCEFCGKALATQKNYQNHLKSIHGKDECKKCICNICGKRYVDNSQLNRHFRMTHSSGLSLGYE